MGAAASALSVLLPVGRPSAAAAAPSRHRLSAAPGRATLLGADQPATEVWCYNGTVPGPELHVRRGARLRVQVENRLGQETSIHWHGLRVPNAMDGVPGLTQAPIAPGERFTYEFDALDAGTFWYHPHARSFEQVDRGLHGVLIVEEEEPIRVDREVVWVLDDWRLLDGARMSEDFGIMHDASHDGRVGNAVTVNGRTPGEFRVRAGERLRLRLVNVANARIFALGIAGHRPWIVAFDGQAVEPHEPDEGRIVLGPGQRTDLVLDTSGKPGARFIVTDTFYRSLEYPLLAIVYSEDAPLRPGPSAAPIRLRPNPLPEPQANRAERHEIVFGGGMMGRLDMRDMMRRGMAWTINGTAIEEHRHEPLLVLARGSTCRLMMRNDTAWYHPIHLHGHVFRVLARNGRPTRYGEWRDTVLIAPDERVEIGFVADNPGDWMIHCHVLEHQATGMTGVIRVA